MQPHGRIIGGLGSPHAPSIGAAYIGGKDQTPAWKPLFDGYKPMQEWLARKNPDLLIVVANDHANTFFFDRYPTFAVGVAALHEIADEGWGKWPLPKVPGHSEFAWQLAHSLVDQEFDIAVCQEMPLDHGFLTPLTCFFPPERRWAVPVLPICVNVLQPPIPTAMRCYKLGQAIRRIVEAFPKKLDVVIAGTGGLSHQLNGERYGFNDTEWDSTFLDWVENDPERIARMTHQEFMERGGSESVEEIMWLVMRGALSREVRRVHRNYYLPMVTGFAQVIFEDLGDAPVRKAA
ncbi:MAG: protocatechuate 3,4-dioxygenase [Rhodospirillaceae bacterium]|nr:protocatechuate 3,4-dioxygenase [Rhodospirillaceae bacterium]